MRYAYDNKGRAMRMRRLPFLKNMFDQFKADGYTVIFNFDHENSDMHYERNSQLMEAIWKSHSPNVHYFRLPVEDMEAPEHDIVDRFIDILRKFQGHKILVHCGEGYGRTGTMLSALQLQSDYDVLANKFDAIKLAKVWTCKKDRNVQLGKFEYYATYPASKETLRAVTFVRAAEEFMTQDSHGEAVEKMVQVELLNERCASLAEEAKKQAHALR